MITHRIRFHKQVVMNVSYYQNNFKSFFYQNYHKYLTHENYNMVEKKDSIVVRTLRTIYI